MALRGHVDRRAAIISLFDDRYEVRNRAGGLVSFRRKWSMAGHLSRSPRSFLAARARSRPRLRL